jgi:hypothetical protein
MFRMVLVPVLNGEIQLRGTEIPSDRRLASVVFRF